MSRKEAFIEFVNDLIKNCDHPVGMSEDAEFYWNYLNNSKSNSTEEDSILTDNGKRILLGLQEHTEKDAWKAKELAEVLEVSSRTVSGSIRKLVKDGFVEKLEDNPVIYAITTKGKEFKID